MTNYTIGSRRRHISKNKEYICVDVNPFRRGDVTEGTFTPTLKGHQGDLKYNVDARYVRKGDTVTIYLGKIHKHEQNVK